MSFPTATDLNRQGPRINAMPIAFERFASSRRAGIEALLDRWLPPEDVRPREVHRAMRYATLGPGKRVRPVLALAVAEMFGASPEPAGEAGVAIEMIHT